MVACFICTLCCVFRMFSHTHLSQAFSSLAEAAYESAFEENEESEDEPATCCLSSSFEAIVSKLLTCSQREDSGSSNLRSAAYEALMDLIKFSAKVSLIVACIGHTYTHIHTQDCYPVVQRTTAHILQSVKQVLSIEVSRPPTEVLQYTTPHTQVSQLSGSDRQQLMDMESLLCATLQSLLKKVNAEVRCCHCNNCCHGKGYLVAGCHGNSYQRGVV